MPFAIVVLAMTARATVAGSHLVSRNTPLNTDTNMNTNIFSTFILFLGICLLVPLTVNADVIEYGDFAGDNVDFLDVTERSAEVGALFGNPAVIGNSLSFMPANFNSQSVDGGVDFIDGALSFVVQGQNGFMFDSISVEEIGDFLDLGDASFSEVIAIAFVMVDGQVYNGQFEFGNLGSGNGSWLEGLTINFPSTDQATFFMDNQLFTNADDDGVAFIDKGNITITVGNGGQGVPSVPEPASGLLVLCGIGLMAFRRHK